MAYLSVWMLIGLILIIDPSRIHGHLRPSRESRANPPVVTGQNKTTITIGLRVQTQRVLTGKGPNPDPNPVIKNPTAVPGPREQTLPLLLVLSIRKGLPSPQHLLSLPSIELKYHRLASALLSVHPLKTSHLQMAALLSCYGRLQVQAR